MRGASLPSESYTSPILHAYIYIYTYKHSNIAPLKGGFHVGLGGREPSVGALGLQRQRWPDRQKMLDSRLEFPKIRGISKGGYRGYIGYKV